ncbi:MAG: type III-A CRISPR-associated RAMP protein Csm5 [Eubacteriales bacterium]|nr:type III-A CRISPR-associated RAMP protein Csm5 [Eubacteriales bacterium]
MGPVYIGSGKKINKKEWIFDNYNEEAIMIDSVRMFKYLNKNELMKSYEDFMLKQNIPLFKWMKNQGIYPSCLGKIEKYRLNCSGVSSEEMRNRDIETFIKDGYGMPYVPGSSLKGAIRNVILAKMIEDSNENFDNVKNEVLHFTGDNAKSFLRKEAKEVNEKFFYIMNREGTKKQDMVNDIMGGIRISDSEPIDIKNLILCQSVGVNLSGNDKNLPIFKECLKPGTKITSEISIDTTQTSINLDYIIQAIGQFLENYNKEFLSKFKQEKLYQKNVIYLGGGTGFHTKTVTSQILSKDKNCVEITSKIIDNTLGKKAKREHKHFMDKDLGVSPHVAKLTEFERDLVQFGPCKIEFHAI